MPFDEPELFIGDVESLKHEITEREERKRQEKLRQEQGPFSNK
jgi:thiamine pyrophosphokinase